MPAFICRTCGVQYAPSDRPPDHCPICEDERQYVGWDGQQWTTLDDLLAEDRHNTVEELEPGLLQIVTRPPLAIGQRALIAQTAAGNVMWDCITLVDDQSSQQTCHGGSEILHPKCAAKLLKARQLSITPM